MGFSTGSIDPSNSTRIGTAAADAGTRADALRRLTSCIAAKSESTRAEAGTSTVAFATALARGSPIGLSMATTSPTEVGGSAAGTATALRPCCRRRITTTRSSTASTRSAPPTDAPLTTAGVTAADPPGTLLLSREVTQLPQLPLRATAAGDTPAAAAPPCTKAANGEPGEPAPPEASPVVVTSAAKAPARLEGTPTDSVTATDGCAEGLPASARLRRPAAAFTAEQFPVAALTGAPLGTGL